MKNDHWAGKGDFDRQKGWRITAGCIGGVFNNFKELKRIFFMMRGKKG